MSRPDAVAGVGDNGYFVLRLEQQTVSSVEGLQDIDEWNRLKAAPSIQIALRLSFSPKVVHQ
jgi:hypothetical protein